jgi:thiaminase
MTKNQQSQSNFIGNIQRNLSNTIDIILIHPYIEALEKNEIAKEKLEIFICEQYHIIANDKRNFALMISKASDDRSSISCFPSWSA